MSTETRTPDDTTPKSSGPYLAKVVKHLDTKFMGGIQVELLKLTGSGNNAEATGQTLEAKYMSPFYGVTPLKDASNNAGYKYTQKSYGFWAVPPDVGTTVMVILVEGNAKSCYWIGCIQDEYMNFMIPGKASTKYNDKDTSKKLPVGEYNKKSETAEGRDPTKFIKPVDEDALARLTASGLLNDPIRGISSSSARREAPSMVFGWSTPGPQDRRPGAPRGSYGGSGEQIQVPFNRLGGHIFVMDDGDMSLLRKPDGTYANVELGQTGGDVTKPANELIRLQTRNGHQILLHNSEDLIYIGHGSGSNWVELDANGNINIKAGGDINIDAGGKMNLKAGGDINIDSGGAISLNSGSTRVNELNVNGGVEVSGTVATYRLTATDVAASHPHLLSGGRAGTPAPTNAGSEASLQGSQPNDGNDTFEKRCT